MNVGFAIPRQFMATFIEDAESPLKSRSTWLLYANAAHDFLFYYYFEIFKV